MSRTPAADSRSFHDLSRELRSAFDQLDELRLVLVGGKGGVGKTTIASLLAVHAAPKRETLLISSDPASNLPDVFGGSTPAGLTIERVEAEALYKRFLDEHLEAFVEIGDRGTYLGRDEIRRLFQLTLPGIDELMGWMRIAEAVRENGERLVVVDTAPTGHTLRLITSSDHFVQIGRALERMQAKHHDLVLQLARRTSRDSIDEFISRFQERIDQDLAIYRDADSTWFVPVTIASPLVTVQTLRLIAEVRDAGMNVPFGIMNRATSARCHCDRCREREREEAAASREFSPLEFIPAPDACQPLDSVDRLSTYLRGEPAAVDGSSIATTAAANRELQLADHHRIVFFCGKGGVGKTSCAASVALQLADANPSLRYTVVSVDPAHSLADLFLDQNPPPNLAVLTIDTKGKWRRLRDKLAAEIENVIDSITRGNVSIAHDGAIMQDLIEVGPPGADELFAIVELTKLLDDPAQARIIVDTAPTGHFLRLIDLPSAAADWVREFMRLLLEYKDLIRSATLGEELLKASRALKRLQEALRQDAAAVVVARPERVVIAETGRLIDELDRRNIGRTPVIMNYVTPVTDCVCDRERRSAEQELISSLEADAIILERRSAPPLDLASLRSLVPMRHTDGG